MPTAKAATRKRPRKVPLHKTAARKVAAPKVAGWRLRLFVAGQSPKSTRAFANLKVLCQEHLKGRYEIEVIDLLEHPEMARGNQIVAIPTLVINLPKSVRQIIGDLSNTDRALVGMALQEVAELM